MYRLVTCTLAILLAIPLTLHSADKLKKGIPDQIKSQSTPDHPRENQGESLTAQLSPKSGEQAQWQIISGGGTEAGSISYEFLGTIGQGTVGMALSPNYGLSHGFWQDFVLGGSGSCCGQFTSGFTGNTDCSPDGKRNIADITRLIDRVYLTKTPLCCEENGNADGDIDGKMNIADITRLIDHVYLSKAETAACE